jgi:hypothetical protein
MAETIYKFFTGRGALIHGHCFCLGSPLRQALKKYSKPGSGCKEAYRKHVHANTTCKLDFP